MSGETLSCLSFCPAMPYTEVLLCLPLLPPCRLLRRVLERVEFDGSTIGLEGEVEVWEI